MYIHRVKTTVVDFTVPAGFLFFKKKKKKGTDGSPTDSEHWCLAEECPCTTGLNQTRMMRSVQGLCEHGIHGLVRNAWNAWREKTSTMLIETVVASHSVDITDPSAGLRQEYVKCN